MKTLDIVLAVLIIYTVYILYNKKNNEDDEYFTNDNNGENYQKNISKDAINDKKQIGKFSELIASNSNSQNINEAENKKNRYLNDLLNSIKQKKKNNKYAKKEKCDNLFKSKKYSVKTAQNQNINSHLLDVKFHNDYRDAITAFNNLAPAQKQIFNVGNIPVSNELVDPTTVSTMVNDFITNLNKNIRHNVPETRTVNSGWDEVIPDPTIKSGWEIAQESLGLAGSLYNNPASNNIMNLVQILSTNKYSTEDEIKYLITMVLSKTGVDDQMLVKVSFIEDRRFMTDENNFFKNNIKETTIIIEEIDILGFLTNYGTDDGNVFDPFNFYNFESLDKSEITDNNQIIKELMKRHNDRMAEVEYRTALLDEEARDFYRDLPNVTQSKSYQVTRDIVDDMKGNRGFDYY